VSSISNQVPFGTLVCSVGSWGWGGGGLGVEWGGMVGVGGIGQPSDEPVCILV
jgi:hypothetical protein